MTPEQKIKQMILHQAAVWTEEEPHANINTSNVDELYEDLEELGDHWDALSEARGGELYTGIPCESSRNYESDSVAAQAPDGSWVGWTYWTGGGKHGEPEAIDWMCEAYDLDVQEEEKLVIVRKFSKAEVDGGKA